MKKSYLSLIVVALFFVAVLVALDLVCRNGGCAGTSTPAVSLPTNFADCAAWGFPVTQSSPRQCRAGPRIFVEPVVAKPVENDNVTVASPMPNTRVQSPLAVTGEARGSWYFEASFPVVLYDANEKEITRTTAKAKSDWTTPAFVPFEATLTYQKPATPTGMLMLKNDNPSGDPARDQSVTVPVRFYDEGSGIRGSVTIGPTCPVRRPGDVTCKDKPYQSAVGIFRSTNTNTPLQVIPTDAAGKFMTEVEAGDYILQATGGQSYPRCDAKTVTVGINSWTDVALTCDSGIR